MQATFTEEVRSFVVDNFLLGKGEGFSNDASFLEQGVIDSTGILELVSFLEENYRIEITQEELNPENLDSINRIGVYLSRKFCTPEAAQVVAPNQPTYSAE